MERTCNLYTGRIFRAQAPDDGVVRNFLYHDVDVCSLFDFTCAIYVILLINHGATLAAQILEAAIRNSERVNLWEFWPNL